MSPFIWKTDRRRQMRDEIEERGIDLPDRTGQRALKLIERGPRLERRHGFDEIGHRLRLRQVYPAVDERSKRELPRLRQPRARFDRGRDDARQYNGAAVLADLGHIVSRVRRRSGKVADDDLTEGLARA